MFCRKCGNPIEAGTMFCSRCGVPVQVNTPPAPAQAPPAAVQTPPAARAAKPKKARKPVNKKALWIGLGAAALVIAAVLVVLFVVVLPGGGDDEGPCLVEIQVMEPVGKVLVSLQSRDISMGEVETTAGDVDGGTGIMIDIDDLMRDPVDIEFEQRDKTGALISRSTLEGLMIIDTEIEDDVDWDDYEECRTLYVSDAQGEIDLKDIAELKNITALYLDYCPEMDDIDDLEDMPQLETLYLMNLRADDLDVVGTLPRLKTLVVQSGLDHADFLEGMTSLKTLWLGMYRLEDLDALAGLKNLSYLRLSAFVGDADALEELTGLKTLEFWGAAQLEDLRVLTGMKSLESLVLYNMGALEDLDALEELPALKKLEMMMMRIDDIDVLGKLNGLEALSIYTLPECDDFDALGDMQGVVMLKLADVAPGDIDFLEDMEALEYVYLADLEVDDEGDARDVMDRLDRRHVDVETGSTLFAQAQTAAAVDEPQPQPAPEPEQEPEPAVTEEPVQAWNIVVSVPSLSSEFYQMMTDSMTQALAARCPQADVALHSSEYDSDAQATRLSMMLQSGDADAIIVVPMGSDAMAPVYQMAADMGVPVVALAQPGDAAGANTVYADYENDGAMAAHMMLDRMAMMNIEPEGKVAVLTGRNGIAVLDERTAAFIATITQHAPGIEIVDIVDIDLDIETAHDETAGLLTKYPGLIGIFGDMGSCGQGAAQALESAGKTDAVTLVTFDISSAMIGFLRSGAVDAVITNDLRAMGEMAAEMLAGMLEGSIMDTQAVVEPLIVTIENVDEAAGIYGY